MSKFIFLLLLALSKPVFATSEWYEDKNRGWFWYEDSKNREEANQDKELFKEPATAEEAIKQIMKIRKVMEEVKSYAILTQKPANTARYIRLQKYVLLAAGKFNISWQNALRLNPELDESIKNPVSGYGKEITQQILVKQEQDKIEKFGNEYGLLLLVKEDCVFCHAFLPVVKEFAESYKMSLLASSIDGSKKINETSGISSMNNEALLNSLPKEYVPALYAINPETDEVILISSGLLSLDELKSRVIMAITYKEAK